MHGYWTCCCLTLKVQMAYINDLNKQIANEKIIRINSISPIALPNLILLNYTGSDLNQKFSSLGQAYTTDNLEAMFHHSFTGFLYSDWMI